MSYNRTPQEAQAIHENVVTLNVKELSCLVPPVDYLFFHELAAAGQDVYAYKIETAPSGATIAYNVWVIDVRIPYSNTPKRWELLLMLPQADYQYALDYLHISTGRQVSIVKQFLPKPNETHDDYIDRVSRHLLSYIQHLNVFGGEPTGDVLIATSQTN